MYRDGDKRNRFRNVKFITTNCGKIGDMFLNIYGSKNEPKL